jgi:hypothetical protein
MAAVQSLVMHQVSRSQRPATADSTSSGLYPAPTSASGAPLFGGAQALYLPTESAGDSGQGVGVVQRLFTPQIGGSTSIRLTCAEARVVLRPGANVPAALACYREPEAQD